MNLALSLLGALMLGLRHGVDLDHIAAITDITGSAIEAKNGLKQSLYYALGHALVVTLLSLLAILFAASLPIWVDNVMERIVGFTLVLLGFYLLNSVFFALSGSKFQFQSRWSLIVNLINKIGNRSLARPAAPVLNAGAFSLGMVHGIGAETATQVLLLSAVGGMSSQINAIAMLLAFVGGLLISNTAIALIAMGGFSSALKLRPVYLVGGVLAGIFSLYVGGTFIAGG